MTETATKSSITLKGSAKLVAEYFEYGLSSILYQRGIYPTNFFERTSKYGTSVHTVADKKLREFLKPLFPQVEKWLEAGELRRLVLAVTDARTREVLERWQFDVAAEPQGKENDAAAAEQTSAKPEAKIRKEIGDVIRQIVATMTFLPLLEHRCSFDVLIYTGQETEEPVGWAECGPALVANAETVDLRSFSTGLQKVGTKVTYKTDDPDAL